MAERIAKKRLPKWSSKNESKKGFKFYWFNIDIDVVSHSCADLCENQLAKYLFEKITDVNNEKLNEEIHVGNGKFVDLKKDNYDVHITVDNSIKRDIDNIIEGFLKDPIPLKLKKLNREILIKNINIGDIIGEYDTSKCNKKWDDVVKWN